MSLSCPKMTLRLLVMKFSPWRSTQLPSLCLLRSWLHLRTGGSNLPTNVFEPFGFKYSHRRNSFFGAGFIVASSVHVGLHFELLA
jgi:hypothetical protein